VLVAAGDIFTIIYPQLIYEDRHGVERFACRALPNACSEHRPVRTAVTFWPGIDYGPNTLASYGGADSRISSICSSTGIGSVKTSLKSRVSSGKVGLWRISTSV
jgi:hypothetical protein